MHVCRDALRSAIGRLLLPALYSGTVYLKAGILFVCGWQVKLCDPLVTRESYPSALRDKELIIKRYINPPSLFFTLPADVRSA